MWVAATEENAKEKIHDHLSTGFKIYCGRTLYDATDVMRIEEVQESQ